MKIDAGDVVLKMEATAEKVVGRMTHKATGLFLPFEIVDVEKTHEILDATLTELEKRVQNEWHYGGVQ